MCDDVKRYVNKHIAHLDADRDAVSLTLGDVHGGADTVYEVFHHWYQLISNTSLAVMDPQPWEYIFTAGWIGEDDAAGLFEARSRDSKELEDRVSGPRKGSS